MRIRQKMLKKTHNRDSGISLNEGLSSTSVFSQQDDQGDFKFGKMSKNMNIEYSFEILLREEQNN